MKIEATLFEYIFNEDIYVVPQAATKIAEQTLETNKPNWLKNGTSKEVIVIVKKSEPLNTELSSFLEKIITAVKFPYEELTICTEFPLNDLITDYKPKKIILFNLNPFELGLKDKIIQLYEPTIHQNVQFLRADSLSVLQQNVDKKKSLWLCLQRVFF